MRLIQKPIFIIVAIGLLASLTACAPTATRSRVENQRGELKPSALPIPKFRGVWAEDFADAYRRSHSDIERVILSDEAITDAEFLEVKTSFTSCLRNVGIKFGGFGPAGGFDFSIPKGSTSDRANADTDKCSRLSGIDTVASLYFSMRRNPSNLDEPTIVADCLVRSGAVSQGYTADDFRRDSRRSKWPLLNDNKGKKLYDACLADPLGILTSSTARPSGKS